MTELQIPDLFDGSSCKENCPVHLRGVWSGLTVPTNRAPQCHVNGQTARPRYMASLVPALSIFRSSVARTPTFMSRRRALNFTRAPASQHVRRLGQSCPSHLLKVSRTLNPTNRGTEQKATIQLEEGIVEVPGRPKDSQLREDRPPAFPSSLVSKAAFVSSRVSPHLPMPRIRRVWPPSLQGSKCSGGHECFRARHGPGNVQRSRCGGCGEEHSEQWTPQWCPLCGETGLPNLGPPTTMAPIWRLHGARRKPPVAPEPLRWGARWNAQTAQFLTSLARAQEVLLVLTILSVAFEGFGLTSARRTMRCTLQPVVPLSSMV